jgi:hypothetical protein
LLCDGFCVDITTSPLHCGRCNNSCPATFSCIGGSCACSPPSASCGGRCVNLNNDRFNCGACGTTCRSTQICRFGRCVP